MAGTRRWGLLFGAGALALLGAACGGGGTPSGSAATTGTAATTTSGAGGSTSSTEGAGGGSGSGGGGAAAISSVIFTGTTMAPTVTINGSGLGSMPAANPTYTPAGTQLCPLAPPAGNQGYDYGTSLYLYDSGRNWAGGRYRPELSELDCVGLLVSKFSASQVVFQFGAAYAQYGQQHNYLLAEGDPYQIAVNGATFSGSVHYT